MTQPTVHLLVLNYCSLEDTLACVSQIRRTTYPSCRLLVIDNGSPDGSGQVLEKELGRTEFLQMGRNTGYAGGNNEGFRRALASGADYVFVVNPDVRVPPDGLREYVGVMERDPSIWALNPVQLTGDGKEIDRRFRSMLFEQQGHAVPEVCQLDGQVWDVDQLLGAALFLRRRAIEVVGGFDPLYFAYWEETDYSRRICAHGGRMVVTGRSPILHVRTEEGKGMDSLRLFLRLKGMFLYQLKQHNVSFRGRWRYFLREAMKGVIGRRTSDLQWERWHYVSAGMWIILHLVAIERHRHMDLDVGPYL